MSCVNTMYTTLKVELNEIIECFKPPLTLTDIFAGEVIKTGDLKQIQGEGMPQYRNPFEKGRMILQFNVVFPPMLDPKIADALAKVLPPS